jgi:starch-binding outer membrane protein, SusD/RagB family
MTKSIDRTRLAFAAGVMSIVLVAGCDRVKGELLAPQNPGLVDPSATANPTAALALRVGALGRFKQVVNGSGNESIWQYSGTLADEYKNADFEAGRIGADQRNTDPLISWNYGGTTQSRGFIRDAISSMKTFTPDSAALIGEMYMELAFFEMTLADNYCNGIPLGHTVNGVMTNGEPLRIVQVYDSASAHLDTAIQLSNGADAGSVYINRIARVLKGRVLAAQGNYAQAATFVTGVPTSYQYAMTFSATSGSNGLWSINNSTARISVGDSSDVVNGQPNVIKNALPFASANDPRVPVLRGDLATPKVQAEDGVTTPFYLGLLYRGQFDPLIIASGIDARLIEAEARANSSDIPGMMTILNNLRTAGQTIGNYKVAVMPLLTTTPANKDEAITLLYREKAFWTFGRGQRLADLRKLVRNYGRTDAQVFPTGAYFKGGNYGTDENFPVPSSEQVNPLFTSCLDRKA